VAVGFLPKLLSMCAVSSCAHAALAVPVEWFLLHGIVCPKFVNLEHFQRPPLFQCAAYHQHDRQWPLYVGA